MWPSKHHLGVQLTYGISGNGIVVPEELPEPAGDLSTLQPRIHFPRLRDQGPRLREIENSDWRLPSSSSSDTAAATTSMSWLRKKTHFTIFAPDSVTESLAVESASLSESFAYNPTVGTRIASLELGAGAFADPIVINGKKVYPKSKSGVLHLQGVAYVSGPDYTDLIVSPLLPKARNASSEGSPEITPIVVTDDLQQRANYACCSFPSAVLQIQVSPFLPIIAVRCRTSIYFVEYSWSNEPHNKGPTLKQLPCTIEDHDFTNTDFAHLEFSPSNDEIALIDVKGNISTWSLDYQKVWSVQLRHPSEEENGKTTFAISDPEDLSGWKNICWHPSLNAILAVSRQTVTYFQFENLHSPFSQKIVTAKSWSRIWDVKSCMEYVILLTSNEIILLRFGEMEPVERLLSWKHFLDSEASTYKLHVCEAESGKIFVCSVFSKETPIAMIYTFGIKDSKPVLLRDPYYLRTKQECMEIFFETLDYNDNKDYVFYHVQSAPDGLSVSTLHGSKKLKLNPSREPSASREPTPDQLSEPIFSWISLGEASNAFFTYSMTGPTEPENDIWGDEDADEPLDQAQLVQKFAFKLGGGIKKLFRIEDENGGIKTPQDHEDENSNCSDRIPSYHSLASTAKAVPIFIDDMDEFDSMVEQLSDFYAAHGIEVEKDFKTFLSHYYFSNRSSKDPLKAALDDMFPESRNVNQAAAILASSICKVSHEDLDKQLQKLCQEEMKGCDNELNAMFDDWELALTRERAKSAPPTVDTKKRGLLHRALTQNSQVISQQRSSQFSSQLSSQPSEPDSSQDIASSLPPAESSQDLFVPSQTQPSQSQSRPAARTRQIKRPLSQTTGLRKKKKKGGFA